MTDRIWVLDTETTGLNGYPYDVVVEVGVSVVDLDYQTVTPVYTRVIQQWLTRIDTEAWVFKNTTLTVDEVTNSKYTPCVVADDLRMRFTDCPMTAYNRQFDFDKFLNNPPYRFHPQYAPCIMRKATEVMGIEDRDHGGEKRFVRAQTAYTKLCPENPAKLKDGIEEHRALSDSILEGYILLALCNQYPEIENEFREAAKGFKIGDDGEW